MTTDNTTALSPWATTFLLAGPAAAGPVPRDAHARAELKRIWGTHGEHVRGTWRTHERFLRAAAAERSIQPRFNGAYFGEALAATRTNNTGRTA
jgi:hypothetical protein